MQSVTLNTWSPGYVATRLTALLRQYHFGLKESHHLASDFTEGRRVSVLFDRPEDAERFADELRQLHVDAFVTRAIAAAS